VEFACPELESVTRAEWSAGVCVGMETVVGSGGTDERMKSAEQEGAASLFGIQNVPSMIPRYADKFGLHQHSVSVWRGRRPARPCFIMRTQAVSSGH
jgi:hypothetical protein